MVAPTPAAIWGSSPAVMNSLVPSAMTPKLRAKTTRGMRTGAETCSCTALPLRRP
jgi:hypothetical protein